MTLRTNSAEGNDLRNKQA
jgi:hypothetical protein